MTDDYRRTDDRARGFGPGARRGRVLIVRPSVNRLCRKASDFKAQQTIRMIQTITAGSGP
jgi:hypothetical protein